MVKIKKILKSIIGLPSKSTEVVYPLDPERIRLEEINQALISKVNALEGQMSRDRAEKKEKQEKINKQEQEKLFIGALKNQESELRTKKLGNSFSLKKFFFNYFKNKNKLKQKLEITDRDDEVIFGKFGDILIFDNGYLGITSSDNELISYGKGVINIIHKPNGLTNQIRRRKIQVPIDKNGKKMPNIELEESSEVIWDEEEKVYKESEVLNRSVKEMIIEREELIKNKNNYIERLEKVNGELKRRLDDTMRTTRYLHNSNNSYQSELSKVLEKGMQFERRVGEMQMQITKLMESKALHESIIQRLEHINKELLDKVEEAGVTGKFDTTLATVQDLIDWVKTVTPDTIIQQITPEKQPMISPGSVLTGRK